MFPSQTLPAPILLLRSWRWHSLSRLGKSSCSRRLKVYWILSSCSLLIFALAVVFSTGNMIWAQTSTDDVHVEPRREPYAAPMDAIDPAFKTQAAPLKVNVDMVLVPVTVTDPMNRLVSGLGKQNFAVLEGKAAQEIKSFSGEDAPASVGIILDTSSSMSSKIERAREAVVAFFKTANPRDEFFMIAFDDKPQELSDFTSSVEDIQSKLVYAMPKGRTALLDAIYLGISKMRRAKYQRKALLIISDGGDNHSRYSEHEIRSLVKEADVLLYAIGIYDHYFPTEEERLGPFLLSEITKVTGGRVFTIDDPNDLVHVATRISIELRNQYVLGYHPANTRRDGKWHNIRVKLVLPKGLPQLHVYARTGYYAPSN